MNSNYQLRWQQLAHRLIDDLVCTPVLTLPGMPALAREYRVSRLTAVRAVAHLEELGIVAPAEIGKKRKVNISKLKEISLRKGRGSSQVVFFGQDHPNKLTYMTHSVYETFRMYCEEKGLVSKYIQTPDEASKVHGLMASIQPRGVVLYLSPVVVSQVVFSLGIPVVGIGKRYSGIRSFYTNFTGLLVEAFRMARKAGHRRIAAPLVKMRDAAYERTAKVLENDSPGGRGTFSRRYNLPLISSTRVEDYHAALKELFRYTPPTCLILYDLSYYLAASSFLQAQQLRIPDEVSLILLSDDPLLEEILPPIAHFVQYPPEMVRQVFNVLLEQMDGLRSQKQTELSPLWVPGGSLSALEIR